MSMRVNSAMAANPDKKIRKRNLNRRDNSKNDVLKVLRTPVTVIKVAGEDRSATNRK